MSRLFRFKSIKGKMIAGFSAVIFLVVLLGLYNYMVMKTINQNVTSMVNQELQQLTANDQMATTMANRIATARAYVLTGNDVYIDRFNEYTEEGKRNEAIVRELGASEEFDRLIKSTVEWRQFVSANVFDEYDKGNKDIARQNLINSENQVRELMDGYQKLASNEKDSINKMGQQIIASGKKTMTVITIISLLAAVFSGVIALVTANLISTPLKKVMERMKAIAGGDLSLEPLTANTKDEVGQLVQATNEMTHNMRNLLRQINVVSETVTSQSEELTQASNEVKVGAEQVAATMEELASGAETQANSAGNLASIMETFSGKVEEANENGEHIETYSVDVLNMTNEGNELMNSSTTQMAKIDRIVRDAVEKMESLDQQSQEISKLVSVIKDIANQTNLLALNAAIEAARAGEHGKGFAVVADEVRKLAEEVGVSVNDITGFVSNIQSESSIVAESLKMGYTEVEQGTAQIKTTGEMLNKISSAVTEMVSNIQTVSANLSDIAASAQEMNGSVEEIASVAEESAAGVEETAASAQQSSATMEEVAASSKQLAALAEEMNGLVGQFKV
ncbi:chemotaxis protein [Bacillus sp. FJAT-27231]|uniref:methyl-accepting chemotaxis protein n=1 Tax=Bacillus sp. FJAT-27231 TaxID=1679168 RepID=UPI000670E9C0|nr:methyl-accepting chemotaxis protein [Bacillus sp. FJAT-27231]KMY52955.1 chemotaxis protein [Bacillus sp. FJAT-27231]